MKEKLMAFLKKQFIKNVIIVASGTAGAQAIVMTLSPAITRIYGPEAFGLMGSFLAIVRAVEPVVALTYPIAIVLPKHDHEAKGLIRLSLTITAITAFLAFLTIILFNKKIVHIFNLTELQNYLFLIPFVIIFAGIMQVAEQWLNRTKQFSINARVTFFESLMTELSKIGIGLFNPAASVLIILTALADGTKSFFMMIFLRKSRKGNRSDKQSKNKQSMKYLMKKYYDFPLYRAPEVFLSAISHGIPVLMLTSFYGVASAGFYTIGRTVLTIPSRLMGKAVEDVFYPRIADAANNKEEITTLIQKATFMLAVICIIPFGLIMIFGPFLFSFVFGHEWAIAGEYARWLILWAFISFISRPCIQSLSVLNAQRFHLLFTIVTLTLRISGVAIGYYLFASDLVSVALFAITSAMTNSALIMITLKISRKSQQSTNNSR